MPEMDLESRLRADAHRAIVAPDFDAALAGAVSPPSRTPRASRAHATHATRWLSIAAAVLVVAGGASAVWGVRTTQDGHAGPAGSSSTVPASNFVSHVATVVLPPDSPPRRYITVYVTASGQRLKGGACVNGTGLKISQGATTVSIHATARLRSDGEFGCPDAGFQNPRTGEWFGLLSVRLDRPLGARRVVDYATGIPVPVFRPTILHTAYLPDTYAPQYKRDVVGSTNSWYDERPGFLSPIAVATEYKPTGKGPWLGIINAPTATVNPGGKVLAHIQIDGHDATVTDSPHARCVTWSPDGRSGRQVCSYPDIVDPLGNYEKHITLLDTDELIKVARGLS